MSRHQSNPAKRGFKSKCTTSDQNGCKSNPLSSFVKIFEIQSAALSIGCCRPPVRLLVLILTTAAFMVQMGLRVSLSVAIVAMVNHTAIPHAKTPASVKCRHHSPSTLIGGNASSARAIGHGNYSAVGLASLERGQGLQSEGEFDWDEVTQGSLLSSFYWGCFITQIPGGFMAERLGSKRVLGISLTLSGALMFILPTAAGWGVGCVMAVRVLQGLASGPVYPCLFPLIARWFPLDEHQQAFGIINAFTSFSVMAMSSLAGLVSVFFGWRAFFYLAGGGALLWGAAWFLFMADTPSEHPLVTEQERERIAAGNVTKNRTRKRPPFLDMLKSPPVLAIVVAEIANSWGLVYFLTTLPTYMKHMLDFDLKANGALSGLPLLGRGLTLVLAGFAGDLALRRGWLPVSSIRRSAAAIVGGGGALLLLMVTFVGCQPAVATLLLCLAGVLNGFVGTGHLVNPLDIAPNYSGSVFGIVSTAGMACSILNPIVTGLLIQGEQTAETWNRVFYLGSAVFFVSLIMYQPMMSTERQWWDKQEDDAEKEESEKESCSMENKMNV